MDLNLFFKMTGFSEEDTEFLLKEHEKIKNTAEYRHFCEKVQEYPVCDYKELEKEIAEASPSLGVNKYTADMLVLCENTQLVKERMNTEDEIFWDTVKDFKYKNEECKKMHGVCGTFVMDWYRYLFTGNRFALGRLQYEQNCSFNAETATVNGVTLNKGDGVINVHIPSAGPLTPESVRRSLEKAKAFFAGSKAEKDGKVIFACNSWLFYPGYREVFGVSENITEFAKLWTPVRVNEKDKFGDCWRVFYTTDYSDADKLPHDTRLQRAFADYIKNGGSFGSAYCIIAM